MQDDRIGLAFHETFALSLPSVSAILRLSLTQRGDVNAHTICTETALGARYVKAMPRYARGCGLLEMGSYRLTQLGEFVCERDAHLIHLNTLWVMHYHLSALHGPGPAFWSHLVTRSLPFGEEIDSAAVAAAIARFQQVQPAGRELGERTLRSTATVFLGSYTKSDGLGQLKLIEPIGSGPGRARVGAPRVPPLGVVAYTLADHWEAHYGQQVTVSLDELAREDGFARVMWMDHRQLDEALDGLKRQGIVDLYRVAPPYQVARLWANKEELLDRLYA